ncbi:MAG: metalloregulator ArsR/SmtB family transcription factor [Thermoguttaceae bacterium]
MQPDDSTQVELEDDEDLEQTDASNSVDFMLRAFSDRTRLRILCLLQKREFCVGDIVDILQVSQPKISRHLAYLRKAGLVTARKSGLWCYYSLMPSQAAFHQKLLSCLGTCFSEVPQIQTDLARAAAIKKSGGCCPPS